MRFWVATIVMLCPLAGQVIKTLDLSTKSAKHKYYVMFAARGGSATGHAFVQLVVKVGKAEFERPRKVARFWECRHEFSILDKDCVEFLRAVAASLNLDMHCLALDAASLRIREIISAVVTLADAHGSVS